VAAAPKRADRADVDRASADPAAKKEEAPKQEVLTTAKKAIARIVRRGHRSKSNCAER